MDSIQGPSIELAPPSNQGPSAYLGETTELKDPPNLNGIVDQGSPTRKSNESEHDSTMDKRLNHIGANQELLKDVDSMFMP